MKWNNKGHEFDDVATEIIRKCSISKEFYIFGAGNKGKYFQELLCQFDIFSGFLDNAVHTDSEKVFGVDEFFETRKDGWIILCASEEHRKEMLDQLRKDDRCGDKYYIYEYTKFFDKVFPVLAAYALNKAFDNLCQISVTERCTLKCEKCAHGCWNVPMNREDFSIENVKASADSYFGAFDYVMEFVLIGGEPFLYQDLGDAIRYIGANYRKQINTFAITTNGTIIPSEEVMDVCKEYDVHIHISNYVKTLPKLKDRYEMLCTVLDEHDISYDLSNKDNKWVDYGFDSLVRSVDENLEEVFDRCKTPCREIRGNKYYFCVQARAVGENMSFDVNDDYLDLNQIKGKDGKRVLMEFGMGYSEKGYLDMCRYCYGAEAADRVIPRAVQKEAV